MRLSGLISIVEPGWDLRARYRWDISGITSEDGVDALAIVKLNSGSPGMFSSTAFGFSVTRISRHCGVLAGFGGLSIVIGPVGVIISFLEGCSFSGAGGIDSKACTGRASKNSCAKMNGVLSSSVENRLLCGPSRNVGVAYLEVATGYPQPRLSGHQSTCMYSCVRYLSLP